MRGLVWVGCRECRFDGLGLKLVLGCVVAWKPSKKCFRAVEAPPPWLGGVLYNRAIWSWTYFWEIFWIKLASVAISDCCFLSIERLLCLGLSFFLPSRSIGFRGVVVSVALKLGG